MSKTTVFNIGKMKSDMKVIRNDSCFVWLFFFLYTEETNFNRELLCRHAIVESRNYAKFYLWFGYWLNLCYRARVITTIIDQELFWLDCYSSVSLIICNRIGSINRLTSTWSSSLTESEFYNSTGPEYDINLKFHF